MSIINNYFMAAESAVKTLARRIGKDIGKLGDLKTTNKTSIVSAVNELKTVSNAFESNYAKKTDLTPLATKSDLSIQIADLIGGADADNDTLKEIADRVTALAQADNGLVSVSSEQIFDLVQKETARKNIDAVSTTELNTAVDTLNNTHAKRSELEQAKSELSDSIEAKSSQLLGAITAEEVARKAEDEAIRGELALTNGKIQEAIDAIPEVDLTSFTTKVELTQAITDLINGSDTDADTLKELADKITALAQADNGLVSALEAQEFSESQKQQARDNIDAAAKSDIPDISGLATKAESDTNYHKKAVTYTRTEMDGRYSQIINTYTKDESDSNFAPKALTYLKSESDGRYPLATNVYTKTESDGKYALKSASYTKAESDTRYYDTTQANARFALKAEYEYVGVAYTKAQSDANYHKKTVTYTRTEMDARYPLKAASYTKAETDGRYAKVWTGTLTEYNAITTKDGNTIYIVT